MKRIKTLVLISLVASLIWSCSKDEEEENSKSKTELLVQNQWTLSGLEIDTVLPFPFDTLDATELYDYYVSNCDKDDFYDFKSDNTGLFDEGPRKCEPNDLQQIDFDWQWSDGESVLTLTYSDTLGTVEVWNDVQLTENSLIVRTRENIYYQNAKVIYTFSIR